MQYSVRVDEGGRYRARPSSVDGATHNGLEAWIGCPLQAPAGRFLSERAPRSIFSTVSSLDRLAEACGIQPDYFDYQGRHRTVSAETKAALLHAMGVCVDDEAAMAAELERIDLTPWRQVLRPASVLRENVRPLMPVRLPAELCRAPITWGIALEDGEYREGIVSFNERTPKALRDIDGREYRQYLLQLPLDLQPGYHDFRLCSDDGELDVSSRLIIAPESGYGPEEVTRDEHTFGVALQLYTARSQSNWGMGDLGDLRRLAPALREVGADYVGLNPMHALYPYRAQHASPYSPSSRSMLNALYIDVTAVPEFDDCAPARELAEHAGFRALIDQARRREHVDYALVARLKLDILGRLFSHFEAVHIARGTGRAQAMQRFVAEAGEPLLHQALYDALAEHFLARDPQCIGWQRWPVTFHSPTAQAVLDFAAVNRSRIMFFEYLQWLADEQLSLAQQAALGAGMNIGLYRDLAVGVDPGGAEAWGDQPLYCFDASVGAPPDPLALLGQDWGLPPIHPQRLAERGYRDFTRLVRANMRHCGALRIDHVMAMMRLWWVPKGRPSIEGAYVSYPLEDMLGIIALESRRNECLVVGEDLGTVPDEIRAPLHNAGIYSYRVLYFEKSNDGEYLPPSAYRDQALATPTTHDLPTLWGFWEGHDLALRDEFSLFPNEEIRNDSYRERSLDRARLLRALAEEGLAPSGWTPEQADRPCTWELIVALQLFLARSQSALLTLQFEDMLEMRDPVNLPGTSIEHRNWSRKLTADWEGILAEPRVKRLFDQVCQARARASLRRLRR
jgi:4-alpha-glucanotransferase